MQPAQTVDDVERVGGTRKDVELVVRGRRGYQRGAGPSTKNSGHSCVGNCGLYGSLLRRSEDLSHREDVGLHRLEQRDNLCVVRRVVLNVDGDLTTTDGVVLVAVCEVQVDTSLNLRGTAGVDL